MIKVKVALSILAGCGFILMTLPETANTEPIEECNTSITHVTQQVASLQHQVDSLRRMVLKSPPGGPEIGPVQTNNQEVTISAKTNEHKRMLSPADVAEQNSVDRDTVYRWIQDGKLEATKAGRLWLISRDYTLQH